MRLFDDIISENGEHRVINLKRTGDAGNVEIARRRVSIIEPSDVVCSPN